MRFVALLRGINVGKSVQVPMKTLTAVLEGLGLTRVVTYLNSGNVVFDSDRGAAELSLSLAAALEQTFGQSIPVLIKTADEMIQIQEAIPAAWGSDETQQTYVAYLFSDIARPETIDALPIKTQYMEIKYAHEAIIWHIPKENFNRSQISKISTYEFYSRMTTRNVTTARKLAQMCREEGSSASSP